MYNYNSSVLQAFYVAYFKRENKKKKLFVGYLGDHVNHFRICLLLLPEDLRRKIARYLTRVRNPE